MPFRSYLKLTTGLAALGVIGVLIAGSTVSTAGPATGRTAYAPLTYSQLSRVMNGETPGPATGPRPSMARSAAGTCQTPYGWLTTSGKWVISASDPTCKVRLTGVTWYGMQTTNNTFAGLNFEPYTSIVATIKAMGMNSIRIPFANSVIENNPIVRDGLLKANPDLQGSRALEILDDVVQAAQANNLMVILDDHFAIARSASDTRNGAVRNIRRSARRGTASPTPGITRDQWIADWMMLAHRYGPDHLCGTSNDAAANCGSQPVVIGFDLFNEPHTQYPAGQNGAWTLKDYLQDGATWGPCTVALCGGNAKLLQPGSDWPTAAEAAGNQILAYNPNLLMFVEGVQLYPDPTEKHWVEPYWWGSILKGVAIDPIVFNVPHQLVYSPHEWGPWKCCGLSGEFNYNTSYKSIVKIFNQNWGYILSSKIPGVQAPIWLGEFNTCNAAQPKAKFTSAIKTAKACVVSTKHGSEGQWFSILMQYLKANPEIGWSYYPLNATNAIDQASNNSLLGCPSKGKTGLSHNCKDPWASARLPILLANLKTIEQP